METGITKPVYFILYCDGIVVVLRNQETLDVSYYLYKSGYVSSSMF